jgi:hypothetical protein
MEKLAIEIKEAVELAPVGRTKVYAAINSGALKARKYGARTIILTQDFKDWLGSLPEYETAA